MRHTLCWTVLFYEDLRQEMLDVVSSTLSRKLQPIEVGKARNEEEGRKKIMAALVGELFTSEPELRAAALHFCKRAMKRRNKIVREVLDQKNVRKNGQFSTTQERARRGKDRIEGIGTGVDLRVSICVPVDNGTKRIE